MIPSASTSYRCIQCLQPCRYLYRRLGSSRNDDIQLSLCAACGEIVDVYCEREGILVALDCLLLRPMAYRHLLCNRFLQVEDVNSNEDDSTRGSAGAPHDSNNPDKRLTTARYHTLISGHLMLYYAVTSSAVRAHIGMISMPDRVEVEQSLHALIQFILLATTLMVGLAAQVLLVATVFHLAGRYRNRDYRQEHRSTVATDPFSDSCVNAAVALLIPLLGIDILTAIIHLWENSPTVRGIGFALVLVHQGMTLYTVLEVSMTSVTPPKITFLKESILKTAVIATLTAAVLAASLAVRAVAMTLCWRKVVTLIEGAMQDHHAMPCPGVQLSATIAPHVHVGGIVCLA
jgi:Arv1-like family